MTLFALALALAQVYRLQRKKNGQEPKARDRPTT